MIICRINEKREWILVQNLGAVKLPADAVPREAAPRNKEPVYDGYWSGEGWVPQSQKAEALTFTLYESAKSYLHENRTAMEQTCEPNETERSAQV